MKDNKIEYGIFEYNDNQIQTVMYPILNVTLYNGLYLAKNIDYIYISGENKKEVKFTNEKERIFNLLNKGEGVVYNKKIMFATCNNNTYSLSHIQFKQRYNKINKDLDNNKLNKYIKESENVAMIKSFITMYHNGVFSKEKIVKKISSYLINSNSIEEVLDINFIN